ncbi:uncharacterized protein HaLaN_09340 [Haematococcus lacustris]|uniref:Uncharacterized protein n=1 Tax=Haematococcus lacustris TaxID=44745 RepID=A0A699ZD85_HAELA|nr:uncharacterized protein HaLaN_09340 [Haematococcus lacustris]
MLPMVGVRARHFVIDDRVLHGVLTDLGMTTLTRSQFEADSMPHWEKFVQYSQLQNSGWDFTRKVETDGVSVSVHFVRNQVVKEPVEPPCIGRELTATSDFSAATHIAVGVDPGVTQAIKATHAMRDLVTGQVLRQWDWELTKGQLKHDSGLTEAKQDTARWLTAIQPQLQQLARATPAGTTLDSLQAHIQALKATWDALWEEYLKPRWRRQRLGLHHAQDPRRRVLAMSRLAAESEAKAAAPAHQLRHKYVPRKGRWDESEQHPRAAHQSSDMASLLDLDSVLGVAGLACSQAVAAGLQTGWQDDRTLHIHAGTLSEAVSSLGVAFCLCGVPVAHMAWAPSTYTIT